MNAEHEKTRGASHVAAWLKDGLKLAAVRSMLVEIGGDENNLADVKRALEYIAIRRAGRAVAQEGEMG